MEDREFRIFKEYLENKIDEEKIYIPTVWNKYIGFNEFTLVDDEVICVEKYSFYRKVVDKIEEMKSEVDFDLKHSGIYCALPRYSTAWDIKNNGELSNGTFIRMLILLPMIKLLGNNVLYLLPITEYSNKNKKGDMGSPFAIKDFYKLDESLHDSIVDEIFDFSINEELKVLIQACHVMGIRVVIDFIPRVTARDSNLIKEHPDWVYWIKKDYDKDFKTPEIPNIEFFTECTKENLAQVYSAESTKKHLQQFVYPPNELNPELWEEIKKEAEQNGKDLFDLVEEKMNITTMSAHSDWINDVQPIWTDITFWKLYMDNQPLAAELVSKEQPPYVMFDTIKANKFPAKIPNQKLWDLFKDVLKYYTVEFSIDGFRFDIGHTLPKELLNSLFETVKKYKPNAIFISEDLFNRNHENAYKTGYNIMLGSSWREVADMKKSTYNKFVKELKDLKLYAYACAETHDTPRIVSRKGGMKLSKALAIINSFLPHGIPFMLTGYEVGEEQPMNCGLADNTNGAPIKKAFFNNIKIDWTNRVNLKMIDFLEELSTLRKELDNITSPEQFNVIDTLSNTLVFEYSRNKLVVIFNYDSENELVFNGEEINENLGDYNTRILSDKDIILNKAENTIKLPALGAVLLYK
ncbi:alpha-amylase family glycosyl hydrolase [uncultured Clostridium sp.]|uniref:alpha-amylase family glycosyl hydrolase n=1 Tax=uncultured Clostridium sp. TaxID=59620 RepID=UPI0025D548CD|nr:alpha-amylase family glycosyl hydrolase [uncultured Clostridium sp.]